MSTKDRGFASMSKDRQQELASRGGKAAHEKGTAHEWTKEQAQAAGKMGGTKAQANRRAKLAAQGS